MTKAYASSRGLLAPHPNYSALIVSVATHARDLFPRPQDQSSSAVTDLLNSRETYPFFMGTDLFFAVSNVQEECSESILEKRFPHFQPEYFSVEYFILSNLIFLSMLIRRRPLLHISTWNPNKSSESFLNEQKSQKPDPGRTRASFPPGGPIR